MSAQVEAEQIEMARSYMMELARDVAIATLEILIETLEKGKALVPEPFDDEDFAAGYDLSIRFMQSVLDARRAAL